MSSAAYRMLVGIVEEVRGVGGAASRDGVGADRTERAASVD